MTNIKEKVNILLIEDDPGDQKLVRLALTKSNSETNLKIIGDGEIAYDFLNKLPESIDLNLIILDLNIPRISGYELLDLISRKGIKTPVMILSTSTKESNSNRDVIKVAKAFYTKPLSLDGFHAIFNEIFSASGIVNSRSK